MDDFFPTVSSQTCMKKFIGVDKFRYLLKQAETGKKVYAVGDICEFET